MIQSVLNAGVGTTPVENRHCENWSRNIEKFIKVNHRSGLAINHRNCMHQMLIKSSKMLNVINKIPKKVN